MTKKERRIAILKDAIKQLKLEKIVAEQGTVVTLPYDMEFETSKEDDMKPVLTKFFKKKEKEEPCFACARGTLLLCTIHKENDFKLFELEECGGSFNKESIGDKRLLRLFSAEQLALMENAFEVDDTDYDYGEDDEEIEIGINASKISKVLDQKSLKFGKRYEKPNDRLLAIFQNAVKNKGIFKP